MTRLRLLTRTAAACGCALLLAAGSRPLRAQLSAAYEEPDLVTPVFDVNRLSLEAPVRATIATVLASGVTYYKAALDAKILGVALRLDPANRAARAAADCRKKGDLPDPKSGNPTWPVPTVVTYLTNLSSALRARGGADNLVLSGYLSDIAAELDSHNLAAKQEKEAFAKTNPPPAWTFLKATAPAAPDALPLLKRQSKIRGLSISELPGGQRTGAVMEIIVTAEEAHSLPGTGVTTSRPVGRSMGIALDEAWRAVKVRHPGTGSGQRLVVSFNDNYTGKDGPSAGAAFALALYSLYDPLQLAADCAMTGDMTVDGRVRAVGGVPWKIHAALIDRCRIVAIPKENASALDDVPLLFPANTLWKLQVFTVDTLDEALAVMREDRPADLQRAMDLFAAVQGRVGAETPLLSGTNADLIPTLKEVLRLAPGHASAAAMLKILEGRGARTLTLYTSLDEMDRITNSALSEFRKTRDQGRINAQTLAVAVASLETLRPRLDYRTAELCAADLAGLRSLQTLVTSPRTAETSAEFHRCVDTLDEVERRMASDPSIVEALRH